MDIFLSLAETDASVRQNAVVTLVNELKTRIVNDRKEASKSNTTVKKTSDDLELPLHYALDRLVKGLGSSRLCARQGFAAALTSVLLNFEYIPTAAVVKIAQERATLAASYTGYEKRDYEVGVAFLFLTFAQAKRVQQLPADFIKAQFTVLHGLQKSSPQMGELVSSALTSTADCMSDSQLSSIFIPAVLSVIPSSFSSMKPHELLLALQLHKIFAQSPQLFVDREKPAYIAHMLAPSNFGSLYGVLEKTLPTYPAIHSVWSACFSILIHETVVTENTVKYHASVQTATGKQNAFARFWQDVVNNLIATQYSFHKKSYSLALMALALDTLFALPAADAEAHHQWFTQQLSNIFLPAFTKLFMTHLKEVTAPAHEDAAKVMETLKRIGEAAQPVAIAIISILSSPEHGGHRQFDIKTHSTLLKTLQKSLDDEGTTLYMETLYDTFQNAEVLAQKDVRAAAEATKDHENTLREEIAAAKTAGDSAAVEEKEAQLEAFINDGIGNVEEFLEGAAAKEAIQNSCETLRLWAVDQLVDMCKNARLVAATREKRANVDKSKNVDSTARTDRTLLFVFRHAFFTAPAAPKPKKGKKTKEAAAGAFVSSNPIIDISEKVRRGCVVGYIALLSSLLNDAYATAGKKRVSGSEMDHLGAVWCDRVMQYWADLETNGYTMGEDFSEASREAHETSTELLKFLREQIEANSPTKKAPFTSRDPRRMQLVRLRSMNLLAVHIAALLPTDPTDFTSVLVDLHQVAARAFADEEDMQDDEDHWIEVLVDLLLSLLVKPSALLRSLCLKVFNSFSADLNAAAVDDILRVVTNSKQEEAADVEESDEDAEEDAEEEEESDDDVVDYKDGRWDPMSGRVEDDEVVEKEEEQEELDFGAALREDANTLDMDDITEMLMNPAFQSSADGQQSAEDKALQDLVKMKKSRNTQQRDVQRETMHFRLRVLDLVELLMKKHPNSALMLRFYEPLLVALQSAVGSDMRAFNDRISTLYTSKLCKPYPVTELPAMPSFLDSTDKVTLVAPEDEASAEDALSAPVADANMIKEVLDNRFRAAKMPLGAQVLALEAKAITRLINQFLSAPPDAKEWNEVASTIAPLAPTPAAKPKKGKKAAAAEPVLAGVDKTAVLTAIRAARAKHVSEKVLTLLVMFAFNKRSTMTTKFFTDLVSKSAVAMWHTPIVSCLSKTVLSAPSTFVRTEALQIISALLKNKQCVKAPADLLAMLDLLRPTLSEAYTKGAEALKVVADASYVKGVKTEAEKQIKVELTDVVKGGKKNQQKGVKVGGAKVQKSYINTLTHLYQQFVVIYRQTEKALGKTPSMEMPKKTKVKTEKKEKKEKKEEPVKEETMDDDVTEVLPAKNAKLMPTTDAPVKAKKSKRTDDSEEKTTKKVKKAKTSS